MDKPMTEDQLTAIEERVCELDCYYPDGDGREDVPVLLAEVRRLTSIVADYQERVVPGYEGRQKILEAAAELITSQVHSVRIDHEFTATEINTGGKNPEGKNNTSWFLYERGICWPKRHDPNAKSPRFDSFMDALMEYYCIKGREPAEIARREGEKNATD